MSAIPENLPVIPSNKGEIAVVSKKKLPEMQRLKETISRIHHNIDRANNKVDDWTSDISLSQRRLEEEGNKTYFAKEGDEIVGYATMRPSKYGEKKGYYVSYIAIDPKHQGKKIGKILMEKLFTVAKKRFDTAGQHITVDFEKEDQRLQSFYGSFKNPPVKDVNISDYGSYAKGQKKSRVVYTLQS